MNENISTAKAYQRKKNWLFLFNIVMTFVLLVIVLVTGLSGFMRDMALSVSTVFVAAIFFYFVFLSLFFFVFDVAIDFYGGYILEHQFGLSNQRLTGWVWESLKRYVLTFVVALVLVEALYLLIRFSPQAWWFLAWVLWILFSLVLGKLFPVLIVPIFYKYSPVADEVLRERILGMARENGLHARNVYSLNLSKTTKKANAAFCGFGKTRRVILSDSLIGNFSHDEILSVVAHEIGHYKKRHLWKHAGFSACTSLVSFYIIFYCVSRAAGSWGIKGADDFANLPLLGLLSFLAGLVLMPLGNLYSRHMEREADCFALKKTGDKASFISTMRKLAAMNLADPNPNPLIEFFLYSHPSIKKRIEFAESTQMITDGIHR
ncbi:MAG: M48 family metallopeptidase [Candidatus Omnitrophica bacterium]|nr:M48 family metallopeptidase [Candidatus Omnitrophota bacterium]